MNLRQALAEARHKLSAVPDIDDPTLESEILLRYALKYSRARLYMDLDAEIDPPDLSLFREWVERRRLNEPTAYIIQCREFYGLGFYVDRRVLIPRPETELLVEESLRLAHNHPIKSIADIGTGSGVVAISLAVHLPDVQVVAVDISPDALRVARLNAQKHGAENRIHFFHGNLLEPLPEPVDLLAANLPYVNRQDLDRMPSAAYEPQSALDGGESGLDILFRLTGQLRGKIKPGGAVLLEIGLGQAGPVTERLGEALPGSMVEVLPDLAGIARVIKISVPPFRTG